MEKSPLKAIRQHCLDCCGEWARVDDQIKKWTYIKNKFEKGA